MRSFGYKSEGPYWTKQVKQDGRTEFANPMHKAIYSFLSTLYVCEYKHYLWNAEPSLPADCWGVSIALDRSRACLLLENTRAVLFVVAPNTGWIEAVAEINMADPEFFNKLTRLLEKQNGLARTAQKTG